MDPKCDENWYSENYAFDLPFLTRMVPCWSFFCPQIGAFWVSFLKLFGVFKIGNTENVCMTFRHSGHGAFFGKHFLKKGHFF